MIVLAVVLVLVGLGFILAEVFFPSLGLFGLLAAACIVTADVLAFRSGPGWGWLFVGVEIVLVPWFITAALRHLPQTRLGKRMMLQGPPTGAGPVVQDHKHLVGIAGHAESDLRPGGMARLGNTRHAVVALGGLIDAGTPVVVTAVEGNEIRVRAAGTKETLS